MYNCMRLLDITTAYNKEENIIAHHTFEYLHLFFFSLKRKHGQQKTRVRWLTKLFNLKKCCVNIMFVVQKHLKTRN